MRFPATFEAWEDPATWETLEPQKTFASPEGKAIQPHTGSIAWNPWRKRWVTVFMQAFGKPRPLSANFGTPKPTPRRGRRGNAVKILSHDNYTFYNPRLHPEFSPPGSPFLFFEGTYTAEFADHAAPTPRYNYNQILYRLRPG